LQSEHWQVTGYVDNLFNKLYATAEYPRKYILGGSAPYDLVAFGMPRTFGVKLRYTY